MVIISFELISSIAQTTTNAGKVEEKKRPSYTDGGNIN
jgi:hypothetical protein